MSPSDVDQRPSVPGRYIVIAVIRRGTLQRLAARRLLTLCIAVQSTGKGMSVTKGVQRFAMGWMGAVLLSGCAALETGRTEAVMGPVQDCTSGPHCVSSRATDPDRQIAPLRYTVSAAVAEQALLASLGALPRTRVVAHQPGYLHAEVRSAIMRYVDDVTFHFSAPGVIDMRSSSRVGYYDFGVNRDRLERIRADFAGRTS